MLKKILGYTFIVLAIILSVSFVLRFNVFIDSMLGVVRIATDNPEPEKAGYSLGYFTYWITHIGLTIAFWIFGLRWIKRQQ